MLERLVSVEEYRKTSYHPDVDYVDGCIEERNVGEREHGELQAHVWLLLKRRKVAAFIETRLQTSATRYRVPDVCVYEKAPVESVFTRPPLLCIEVLSPEDRMSKVARVADEYLAMGVQVVWVLDPIGKKAYMVDSHGLREVPNEIGTPDGRIVFTLAEVFSEEDDL